MIAPGFCLLRHLRNALDVFAISCASEWSTHVADLFDNGLHAHRSQPPVLPLLARDVGALTEGGVDALDLAAAWTTARRTANQH